MIEQTSNKRLAKNTIFLYTRMVVIIVVKLYTSRIILNILGITDYGVWSAVTAFVLSFNFLTSPLIGAIQRFLNIEMGKDCKKINEVWSSCLILCIILCIILFILLETCGTWFINNKMNFDRVDITTVNKLFQISIISSLFIFLRMAYEAAIIAYEKMSAYALLCIAESLLLLGGTLLLQVLDDNFLIAYALITLVIQIGLFFSYKIYTNYQFKTIRFTYRFNKGLIRKIGSYIGWNFLGSFSSMSANSGLSIILNIFFGVIINAAYSITMQIGSVINQLVTNLLTAINPQIVKSYAQNNYTRFNSLIYNGSKFSVLLLLLPLIPIYINIEFILNIWLGSIPPFTVSFCRIYMIYMILSCFSGVLSTACLTLDNIRRYQLIIVPLVLCNIIISYILLKFGGIPQIVLYVKIIVEILILAYRLVYLKYYAQISILTFFKKSIIPVLEILLIISFGLLIISHFINSLSPILKLITTTSIFIIVYIPSLWYIGLTFQQRCQGINYIHNKISSIKQIL